MAKRNRNFFTQMRDEFGENFLNYIDNRSLQLKCLQIFRQMSRGQINTDEFGKYFLDPRLMEACLVSINAKLKLHSISYDGMMALQDNIRKDGFVPSADIVGIAEFHKICADAYGLIQSSLDIINKTRDLSVLIPLVANLSNYRNYI